MILNNAKNIYIGDTQVKKIICNSIQIWSATKQQENLPTSNVLPYTFSASDQLIKKYQLQNNTNNSIGAKTLNLSPDTDKWNMNQGMGADGGIADPYTGWMTSNYIEIEPQTQYIFTATQAVITSPSNRWHRICCFNENKEFISYSDINYFGQVFTTPANSKYLRIFCTIWNKPILVKYGQSTNYIPCGYDLPITLNNTSYHLYILNPNWKKIEINDFNNVSSISFQSGPQNTRTGSTLSNFVVYGPEDNHYIVYGKVNNLANDTAQKYILNTWGSTNPALNKGTYTMSLTVYNPPLTDTWCISLIYGTGTSTYNRVCMCTSSNVSNGIATSYETITVDETAQTQLSWMLIEFEALGESPQWYNNVVVDVRVVEGTEPAFPIRTLTTINNEIVPISIAPKLITTNGTNTIDINTSPKPTGINLTLE